MNLDPGDEKYLLSCKSVLESCLELSTYIHSGVERGR